MANEKINTVVDTIAKNARTGVHGDGIIIVTAVEQALNILTMEKGENLFK